MAKRSFNTPKSQSQLATIRQFLQQHPGAGVAVVARRFGISIDSARDYVNKLRTLDKPDKPRKKRTFVIPKFSEL